MLLKERTYRTCKSCKSLSHLRSEVYGCDGCRKVLDMNKPEVDYLRANIHRKEQTGLSQEIVCCSWKCMMKSLRKVKCDYFISLPFLHFDEGVNSGIHAKGFFDLMSRPSTRKA